MPDTIWNWAIPNLVWNRSLWSIMSVLIVCVTNNTGSVAVYELKLDICQKLL